MKNYIQAGDHITLTADADTTSGDGKMIGVIFGVAQETVLSGEPLVLVRKGVFELPKLEAQAWTQGQRIYWDDGNSRCTTSASGNAIIGAAAEVAANPSTTGIVLLDGAIR